MILKLIGVLIFVGAVALIINFWEETKKKNNTKISFKEAMDLVELPVVTFINGDKKLNFLLDTGSNTSYINSSIISTVVHEALDKEKHFIGVEGNKIHTQFCKMSIKYKNQVFEEEFGITDLDNAFDIIKQESGVQIHGILGSKFFDKYKYIIDFKDLIAYTK